MDQKKALQLYYQYAKSRGQKPSKEGFRQFVQSKQKGGGGSIPKQDKEAFVKWAAGEGIKLAMDKYGNPIVNDYVTTKYAEFKGYEVKETPNGSKVLVDPKTKEPVKDSNGKAIQAAGSAAMMGLINAYGNDGKIDEKELKGIGVSAGMSALQAKGGDYVGSGAGAQGAYAGAYAGLGSLAQDYAAGRDLNYEAAGKQAAIAGGKQYVTKLAAQQAGKAAATQAASQGAGVGANIAANTASQSAASSVTSGMGGAFGAIAIGMQYGNSKRDAREALEKGEQGSYYNYEKLKAQSTGAAAGMFASIVGGLMGDQSGMSGVVVQTAVNYATDQWGQGKAKDKSVFHYANKNNQAVVFDPKQGKFVPQVPTDVKKYSVEYNTFKHEKEVKERDRVIAETAQKNATIAQQLNKDLANIDTLNPYRAMKLQKAMATGDMSDYLSKTTIRDANGNIVDYGTAGGTTYDYAEKIYDAYTPSTNEADDEGKLRSQWEKGQQGLAAELKQFQQSGGKLTTAQQNLIKNADTFNQQDARKFQVQEAKRAAAIDDGMGTGVAATIKEQPKASGFFGGIQLPTYEDTPT